MPKQPTGLESPVVCAQVKAMFLDGKGDTTIAKQFNVSRQAVAKWRHRHAAELMPVVAAIEKSIEDYAIAQKIKRVAAMNDRWERGMQLIAIRAGDTRYTEPGYETGLMVHKLKMIGSGEFAETVDEYAVDTGLLAALDRVEEKAATEMGQLPKNGDGAGISFGDGTNVVIQTIVQPLGFGRQP